MSRRSSYNLSVESSKTVRFLPVCGGGEDVVLEEDPAAGFCGGLPTIEASNSTLAVPH